MRFSFFTRTIQQWIYILKKSINLSCVIKRMNSLILRLSFVVLLTVLARASAEDRIKKLTERAGKGELDAQTMIGFLYANGDGLPRDRAEAANWLRKAADKGYAPAQYELGWMYDFSFLSNFREDKGQALKWYKKAAEQGFLPAQVELILKQQESRDSAADKMELDNWREQLMSNPKTWIQWHRGFAELGFPSAQLKLGWMFDSGRAEPERNHTEAIRWYQAAADQGYAPAQSRLGDAYYWGYSQDKVEAERWYRKAAEQGNADGEYGLGKMIIDTETILNKGEANPRKIDEAIRWLRKAAEAGHVAASYQLGWLFTWAGNGVKKNTIEAIKWYKKAAEQGDEAAAANLGDIYFDGSEIGRNLEEAAKWYRVAAERGERHSQYMLGKLYAEGKGVTKNFDDAIFWLVKAAEGKNAGAQYYLGLMYSMGQGVARDENQAVRWLRLAAESESLFGHGGGHAGAKIALSFIEDPQMRKLKEQADGGIPAAQFRVGKLFSSAEPTFGQVGESWDGRSEAVSWYRKSAEQGYAVAQTELGWSYYLGRGVRRSNTEAVRWYLKAANRGQPDAQYLMGLMYEEGEGVLKDEVEALAWYNVSAISGHQEAAKKRDIIEQRLGQEGALAAQQRSREILKRIESEAKEPRAQSS